MALGRGTKNKQTVKGAPTGAQTPNEKGFAAANRMAKSAGKPTMPSKVRATRLTTPNVLTE